MPPWQSVVDEEPHLDYRRHIRYGFIHFSESNFPKRAATCDDFEVRYGDQAKYITKINRCQRVFLSKCKRLFGGSFSMNRTNWIDYRRPMIDSSMVKFFTVFDAQVYSTFRSAGFSHWHAKKFIADRVDQVMKQSGANLNWLDFGYVLKREMYT